MNKAELLTCTEVQEVGEDPGPLGTGAVLEVLAHFGEKKVFVIRSIAPVKLAM